LAHEFKSLMGYSDNFGMKYKIFSLLLISSLTVSYAQTYYAPEQIELSDSSPVEFKADGGLRMLELNVKGQKTELITLEGKISNISPDGKNEIRLEARRLRDEISAKLASSSNDRLHVQLKKKVIEKTSKCRGKDKAITEAQKFLKNFKLSSAYESDIRIRRSHFGTGPRLSETELNQELAVLSEAAKTASLKHYDLNLYFNCIDDQDVCEEIFINDHARRVCELQAEADLLTKLRELKGIDFIVQDSVPRAAPSEIYDGESSKEIKTKEKREESSVIAQ
jgi:hypothetical protein